MLVPQLIFDGLAMGVLFVLLACGLVLIASVSRILFLAYGSFYTIGGYVTWYASRYGGFPYFVSLAVGILVSALIALLSYYLIFRRLQNTENGFLATLIASMGLSMVLTQGGMLFYGTTSRGMGTVFAGSMDVLGIYIKNEKLALIVISIATALIMFFIYERTDIGRRLRSVAFNLEASSLLGVNTQRMLVLSLVMGCALAGMAGGLLAPAYGINPSMGQNVLWTVMLMCMLGGMDSLLGAALGGMIVGQLLSFGQYFIGSTIQIIVFVLIGILLYFRPNGLLGRGINIDV